MADKYVLKKDLAEFLGSLTGEYQVLGPVERDGRIILAPAKPEEFKLDYQNTYLSPKDLFFPQSERMLEFTTDPQDEKAHILREVGSETGPRVVFGLRPCDAKAFFVLDKIFNNDEYTDPYWQQKREATTLIGLGCNDPCPTCFCSSVNCGPFHQEGLDMLACDLGEGYLLRPLTEKGGHLLEKAKGLSQPPDGAAVQMEKLEKAAEESITSKVSTENIFKRTVMELYEAKHWDRVQESCLNCGTCTFFCPTCHCFDIQDEVHHGQGDRVRNWDSCMSWLFTHHGSGHNPRPGKKERVRQRFMHKFKYIPMKREGEVGCVGCGRCVVFCPVNIDVRDVVRDMND